MDGFFDYHVHIGQFFEMYYDAKTVFTALRNAGAGGCMYSSTTSGEAVDSEQSARRLYRKITAEIHAAQHTAADLGLDAQPLYWVIPAVHRLLPALTLEAVMRETPYTGFKLHPRAHRWDISDPVIRTLTQSVFRYADAHRLPILIHTGHDVDCADLFEPFFPLCKNGTIILAHCRPLETALRLLAHYRNVFCDTAFVELETIDRIKAAGFTANILFGTDFPITDYVYNNRRGCSTCPSIEELYRHYTDKIQRHYGKGVATKKPAFPDTGNIPLDRMHGISILYKDAAAQPLIRRTAEEAGIPVDAFWECRNTDDPQRMKFC